MSYGSPSPALELGVSSDFPASHLCETSTGIGVKALSADALAKPKAVARVPIFCFSIHALAEPGVMPRVLELFAKRNLIPQRWHSDRHGPGGQELSIDLQLSGLDSDTGDYIARCLRQVWGIEQVLTSQKF